MMQLMSPQAAAAAAAVSPALLHGAAPAVSGWVHCLNGWPVLIPGIEQLYLVRLDASLLQTRSGNEQSSIENQSSLCV